jgi:hypothetical protein
LPMEASVDEREEQGSRQCTTCVVQCRSNDITQWVEGADSILLAHLG